MKRDDGQAVREATALALLTCRRECGLTQLELANRVGLSQSHIARLELGHTSLTIEHLFAIARTLRITRVAFWSQIEHARKLLQQPAARAMFRSGRVRVRAPKLRE